MQDINGLRLFAELCKDTPITEPLIPVGKDDEVIGVVPEALRRLQCYLGQLTNEVNQATEAIQKEIRDEKEAHKKLHLDPNYKDEQCDEHAEKIVALEESLQQNPKLALMKAVNTVFWCLLRLELNMVSEGNLTIHTGWAVSVVRESEEGPDVGLPLLQRLISLFGR